MLKGQPCVLTKADPSPNQKSSVSSLGYSVLPAPQNIILEPSVLEWLHSLCGVGEEGGPETGLGLSL